MPGGMRTFSERGRGLPPKLVGPLLGLAIGLGVLSLREFGLLENLELAPYDSFLRGRALEAEPDPRVVLRRSPTT